MAKKNIVIKSIVALGSAAAITGIVYNITGDVEADRASATERSTTQTAREFLDSVIMPVSTRTLPETTVATTTTLPAVPAASPVVPEPTLAPATTAAPIPTEAPTTTTEPLKLPPLFGTLTTNQPIAEVRIPRFTQYWTEVSGGKSDIVPLNLGDDTDADRAALLGGLALRPSTSLGAFDLGMPGMGTNTVIGGHRTSHLAPFRHLADLVPGDIIEITTIWGVTYVYQVTDAPKEIDELELPQYYPHIGGTETVTVFTCEDGTSKRVVTRAVLVNAYNW